MIYEAEKDKYSEDISINIKQQILLKNSISLMEFFLLKEIHNLHKDHQLTSAKKIYDDYPALFKNKRSVKYALEVLLEDGFLTKREDKDLFQSTYSYILTDKGSRIITGHDYTPPYTKEEYLRAIQVVNHWNSLKGLTKHAVKPYGEIQSKTIDKIIDYISDLVNGTPEWIDCDHKFSIAEIVSLLDTYTLRFDPAYKPEVKKGLPKSMTSFFHHYSTERSEFYDVYKHGATRIVTLIDELKEIGIKPAVLKLAYHVLSQTGEAKETEKGKIQESILRTHKRWRVHLECVLDDLYRWKKDYREIVSDYNNFMFEYLKFIEAECGIGNTKYGYLSFNQSNKILQAFGRHLVDKYNIYLFPNEKRKEKILKSKIVS